MALSPLFQVQTQDPWIPKPNSMIRQQMKIIVFFNSIFSQLNFFFENNANIYFHVLNNAVYL